MTGRESVTENQEMLIRHRAQVLDITTVILQHIPTKDLHLHACKVQSTQQLLRIMRARSFLVMKPI